MHTPASPVADAVAGVECERSHVSLAGSVSTSASPEEQERRDTISGNSCSKSPSALPIPQRRSKQVGLPLLPVAPRATPPLLPVAALLGGSFCSSGGHTSRHRGTPYQGDVPKIFICGPASPGTRKAKNLISAPALPTLLTSPGWQNKSPGSVRSWGSNTSKATATPVSATPWTPHAPWRATKVRFSSPMVSCRSAAPYEELHGMNPSCFNVDAYGRMMPPSPHGQPSPPESPYADYPEPFIELDGQAIVQPLTDPDAGDAPSLLTSRPKPPPLTIF